MARVGSIELVVDPSPSAADLRLDACGSLEDFEDELVALLKSTPPRSITIALHARPGAPATVPEAVRAIVAAHERCGGNVRVVCLVGSERARKSAERLIPELARPDRWASHGSLQVGVVQGDIVAVAADAIVNASNVRLVLGAGVSGAIRSAVARPDALQAEMLARAPIEPGEVVATSAHGLGSVRLILHAATASGDERAVGRAYREVLEVAERMHLVSVATPALGCGTGGLAPERSAALLRSAIDAMTDWTTLRRLVCVLYDGETADVFAAALSTSERSQ